MLKPNSIEMTLIAALEKHLADLKLALQTHYADINRSLLVVRIISAERELAELKSRD